MKNNRLPGGIVLAGGKSLRMGCDKASLQTKAGMTWLEHAYAELSSVATPCFVSCAKGHTYPGFPCLEDERCEIGPMGGVISALKYGSEHGIPAILVLACDLPLLNREILGRLLAEYYKTGFEYQVTIFQNKQTLRLEPLAAIYSLEALPNLERACALRQYSLAKAIPHSSQLCILYGVDQAKYFINCNSQTDLEKVNGTNLNI